MLSELRRRGDVHAEPHDALHAVQRTYLLLRERKHIERGRVRRFSACLHVKVFAHDTNDRCRVARGGKHPAQEQEVARLNGRHIRTKRRWRIRQMNAEFGETVLSGR